MNKLTFWGLSAAAIAAIIGFLIISNRNYRKENNELLSKELVSKEVRRELEQNIALTASSTEVTDKIVTEATTKIEENNQSEVVIRSRLERKISEIKNKQNTDTDNDTSKPVQEARKKIRDKIEPVEKAKTTTPSKSQQISEARVDSIWEHYCLATENAAEECKPEQTEGVK